MNFWKNFLNNLKKLEKMGAKIFCIGKSVLQRPIFCIKIGKGKKRILLQFAIHAREHITSFLALLQAKHTLKQKIDGTAFFVPLANPDGVCLCFDGLKSIKQAKSDFRLSKTMFPFLRKPHFNINTTKIKNELLTLNKSENFSLWKANINAVDLNVNFDAHWGQGKQNVFEKAPENFVGPHPNSEPETKILAKLAKKLKPQVTISYHSKGEVIFWKFFQDKKTLKKHFCFAKEIAKLTGYKLKTNPHSTGGFKDFCIEKFNVLSLTIEVGKNTLKHPVSKEHLKTVFNQNKNVVSKSLALLSDFDV